MTAANIFATFRWADWLVLAGCVAVLAVSVAYILHRDRIEGRR